jgi:uncharacterized membrane protein
MNKRVVFICVFVFVVIIGGLIYLNNGNRFPNQFNEWQKQWERQRFN